MAPFHSYMSSMPLLSGAGNIARLCLPAIKTILIGVSETGK